MENVTPITNYRCNACGTLHSLMEDASDCSRKPLWPEGTRYVVHPYMNSAVYEVSNPKQCSGLVSFRKVAVIRNTQPKRFAMMVSRRNTIIDNTRFNGESYVPLTAQHAEAQIKQIEAEIRSYERTIKAKQADIKFLEKFIKQNSERNALS